MRATEAVQRSRGSPWSNIFPENDSISSACVVVQSADQLITSDASGADYKLGLTITKNY